MAVNLSPVGGVAAQFFDNNGVILTGGKIFTYTAGTTTPQATYTSANGATAHSNPIILDASGRVPSGEIWLTDGLSYKFLLKDANDVLIGTYDNIVGINANFINYTGEQEIQTATANQTVFTLTTMQYQPGTNSLSVFVDGVNQYGPGAQYAYVETDADTVTFVSGLHVGASVKFTTSQLNTSGGVDASQVSYDPPFTGSVATNVEAKLAETVSVMDFGAVGDGIVDDTTAIAAAHATGKPVFYPYGTYKHVGYFPECEGGIIGEGWSANNGAKTTKIVFYNCTDTSKAAIKLKESSPKSNFFRIENIQFIASSWDAVTGCLGFGLEAGNSPVIVKNFYIQAFKRNNIFLHHDATLNGPYESLFENVVSVYSGEHGCVVGNGANSLTFINYQGKWNGAPAWSTPPTVAGTHDGFYVIGTIAGYPSYTPQAINILGGDCSYNSRYGWTFFEMNDSSSVMPGYAEDNLVKEAYIGTSVSNCFINFNAVKGGIDNIVNDQLYSFYFITNAFYLGGKQFHPANNVNLVQNPTLPDVDFTAGPTYINAPSRQQFISRNNSFSISTFLRSNATPDGTAVNPATESVSYYGGGGAYAIGIGTGSRHLKIQNNVVRLPDLYYQATSTGWSASSVARFIDSAAPVAGTWTQGDIVFNETPTAGGFIGWVCVTGGTPGTWKTFGAISA